MTKEKPLSEKRKDLYYELKEPLTTEEEEMLLISVFDFIRQQDAEAVKKLKDAFIVKFELSNLPNNKYFEFLMQIDKIFGLFDNHSPTKPEGSLETSQQKEVGRFVPIPSEDNHVCSCGHDLRMHQTEKEPHEMLAFCAGNNYECSCKKFTPQSEQDHHKFVWPKPKKKGCGKKYQVDYGVMGFLDYAQNVRRLGNEMIDQLDTLFISNVKGIHLANSRIYELIKINQRQAKDIIELQKLIREMFGIDLSCKYCDNVPIICFNCLKKEAKEDD